MRDFINKFRFRKFFRRILHQIWSMANSFSNGNTFLSSLGAEMPNDIKLRQQLIRLGKEKVRMGRQVDNQEQQLLKWSSIYKATKFRMSQLDDQIRTIRIELAKFDGKKSEARMDLL